MNGIPDEIRTQAHKRLTPGTEGFEKKCIIVVAEHSKICYHYKDYKMQKKKGVYYESNGFGADVQLQYQ